MQTTSACCLISLKICKSSIDYWSNLTANESRNILSESSNEFVLVISRSREATFELIDENRDIIKIESTSERYALTLFRKKLRNKDDDNEVFKLLRNLNCMSFAINQTATYIRQKTSRITISTYLKDFQRNEKNQASLLNNVVRNRRRNERTSNFVLITWQISFEYIRSNQLSTVKLLSLMSFFDRQKILEKLITFWYEEDDNIMNFEKNIKMLRKYFLIALNIENDMFEIYRLMQFATRKWLKQRQKLKRWKETYIAIMTNAFSLNKYENWKKCQMLFSHAMLMLNYRSIEKNFLSQWTMIVNNIVWYAKKQKRYKEIESINQQTLNNKEKILRKEHFNTLTNVNDLTLMF